MGLAMRLTSSWWNRLSKWRLRWWHRDQQPNQLPSELLHEHLYRLEDITGAYCVVFVSGKKSKIMGSECSLPWDSESRSPSPTYGRYSCIRIELNIYNIIMIYIHMWAILQFMVLENYYDEKSACIWWNISIHVLELQHMCEPSQSPTNHPICLTLTYWFCWTKKKNLQ